MPPLFKMIFILGNDILFKVITRVITFFQKAIQYNIYNNQSIRLNSLKTSAILAAAYSICALVCVAV